MALGTGAWGGVQHIRRLLHKTVIERTLCHGAAVWGHNMTSRLHCSPSGHRSSIPPPTNPTRSNLCPSCSSKIFIQLFHHYIQPNRIREQKKWNSFSPH
ncbi:hypothetical protein AVEN_223373-1 [Araneus ventricosus]|uniref:Uncharacterized protein n=1 Tax=Araneus ventricosus TaxID=182803 RepID=A0A4Y2QQF6_ARAVE|nr:hypothetical protein AVEN_223373-1 [Araneus ventricosus]